MKSLAQTGASAALAPERNMLRQQQTLFTYSTTGLFSDKNLDSLDQFNNTYQIGTRSLGAGQAVLGSLGVAGAMITAPASCATGIGCIASAYLVGTNYDAASAGSRQLISGRPESTYLNQALQDLGMSPTAAGYAELVLGLGTASKVSSLLTAPVMSGSVSRTSTDEAALLGRGAVEGAGSANAVNRGGLATPEGAANAATYPLLKNQLAAENLANIAAQDSRLARAVSGEAGIGSGTAAESDQLGRIWVGDSARLATDQVNCPGCLWSADGTRFYRPPSVKPNTSPKYNPTGVQANFEQWVNGKKISNGHLVVTR